MLQPQQLVLDVVGLPQGPRGDAIFQKVILEILHLLQQLSGEFPILLTDHVLQLGLELLAKKLLLLIDSVDFLKPQFAAAPGSGTTALPRGLPLARPLILGFPWFPL